MTRPNFARRERFLVESDFPSVASKTPFYIRAVISASAKEVASLPRLLAIAAEVSAAK